MKTENTNYLENIRTNIPTEIKSLKQWVMYGPVEIPTNDPPIINEKAPLRVPNQNGAVWMASSNKPDTWSTFATVFHYLKESFETDGKSIANTGEYSGVGFVAAKNTDYVIIDIDHCVEWIEGEPRVCPEIMDLVRGVGSYTEISPSGSGLRIILKYTGSVNQETGKTHRYIDFPDWSDSIHLELYVFGQYGRMTGRVLDPELTQIKENNEQFEKLWKMCTEERETSQSVRKTLDPATSMDLSGPVLDDNKILSQLARAKNSEKFTNLFEYKKPDNSKWYVDDSFGDFSLALEILFYCGNETGRDLKQCLRILKMSPRWLPENRPRMGRISAKHIEELQAEKVNQAYQKLLKDAAKGTAKVYRPGKMKLNLSGDKKQGSGKQNQNGSDYVPATVPWYRTPDNKRFDYERIAKREIEELHIICIDHNLYIYQDGIYIFEPTNRTIKRKLKEIIPSLLIRDRNEVIADLEAFAPDKKPNSKPELIAFNNGVLNIATLEFMDHSPDLVMTTKIPHNYDVFAMDPDGIVENTLNSISNYDKERRLLLEESVGYLFYPSNGAFEKMFIYTGKGKNGKSTWIEFIMYVLGAQNWCTFDTKQFARGDKFATSKLYGKLGVFMDEQNGVTFDDSTTTLMRGISSGNPMQAQFKNRDEFTFTPYCKIFMAANKVPKFSGSGAGATLRRIEGTVVSFENRFTGKSDDPDIKTKLKTDQAAEYMIKIACDAFHDVLERGKKFTVCHADKDLAREHMEDSDPIMSWFNYLGLDDYQDAKTYFIGKTLKQVYQDFREYADSEGFDLKYLPGAQSLRYQIRTEYHLKTKPSGHYKIKVFCEKQ